MANRVITVTQGEIENSEDPEYKASLQQGVEGIKQCESREGGGREGERERERKENVRERQRKRDKAGSEVERV